MQKQPNKNKQYVAVWRPFYVHSKRVTIGDPFFTGTLDQCKLAVHKHVMDNGVWAESDISNRQTSTHNGGDVTEIAYTAQSRTGRDVTLTYFIYEIDTQPNPFPPDEFIPVKYVTAKDVRWCIEDHLPGKALELEEGDLEYIADKLGDALSETYWRALTVILESMIEEKEGEEADES